MGKIKHEKVQVGSNLYVILSNRDHEQLKEIAKTLKKEIEVKTDHVILSEDVFKELEKANKLYKNLCIKKKRAEKFLKSLKILEADIKTYAPWSYNKFIQLVKEMESIPFQNFQPEDFNKFFKLEDDFVGFAAELKEEIREIKEEGLGLYVYCLIPSSDNIAFDGTGLFGKDIYTVQCGDITALVTDLPVRDYRRVDFEDNVKIHNKVIQNVMEKSTTIPLAYNQVWKNDAVLKDVINRAKKDILTAFRKLDGKVEFGLKVLKNNGAPLSEEKLIEDLKALRANVDHAKLGKKFNPDIILNAFYLVSKDKIAGLSEGIEAIKERNKDLKIDFTGPWPPYNFVDIRIGGEDVHT